MRKYLIVVIAALAAVPFGTSTAETAPARTITVSVDAPPPPPLVEPVEAVEGTSVGFEVVFPEGWCDADNPDLHLHGCE